MIFEYQDECFDEIIKGDIVWYEDEEGKVQSAIAYMLTYRGFVCLKENSFSTKIDGSESVYVNEGHNYLGHESPK